MRKSDAVSCIPLLHQIFYFFRRVFDQLLVTRRDVYCIVNMGQVFILSEFMKKNPNKQF